MSFFICPVCGERLNERERSLVCIHGHTYDLSRHGYVNLLLTNQSSAKRHGDDRTMVAARRRFLDEGYYAPLAQAVSAYVCSMGRENMAVLDVGCGECWYTAQVKSALETAGIPAAVVCGVDISKEALIYGAKRHCGIELAVASAARIPVAAQSCDLLLNLFAPCVPEEFLRVLKPRGRLIRVMPLERHLWELKEKIYDRPYENPHPDPGLKGFMLLDSKDVEGRIILKGEESIQNLFKMTPYYYKTGMADQAKLTSLASLETEIAFGIYMYEKPEEG